MTQVADTDPNSIRMPLKVVDESAGEGPFKTVTVMIDAQRVQPAASGGISFRLTVINGSGQALQVQSPIEDLQISLLDSKGWPVRLPQGTHTRTLIGYMGTLEVIRPYQVMEIRDVGTEGDLLSIKDDLHWTLPAEDAIRVGMKINRILPPDSPKPPAQATPVPIPQGSYKLKLIVVLISAFGEPAHRIFNSDYMALQFGEN